MLDEWLDEFSRKLGADYYGVADLIDAGDFIYKQGKIDINHYPRAISIGILLLDSIVNDLPRDLKNQLQLIIIMTTTF